jgi:hypothetical protein
MMYDHSEYYCGLIYTVRWGLGMISMENYCSEYYYGLISGNSGKFMHQSCKFNKLVMYKILQLQGKMMHQITVQFF